jgi:hypothetical protein
MLWSYGALLLTLRLLSVRKAFRLISALIRTRKMLRRGRFGTFGPFRWWLSRANTWVSPDVSQHLIDACCAS